MTQPHNFAAAARPTDFLSSLSDETCFEYRPKKRKDETGLPELPEITLDPKPLGFSGEHAMETAKMCARLLSASQHQVQRLRLDAIRKTLHLLLRPGLGASYDEAQKQVEGLLHRLRPDYRMFDWLTRAQLATEDRAEGTRPLFLMVPDVEHPTEIEWFKKHGRLVTASSEPTKNDCWNILACSWPELFAPEVKSWSDFVNHLGWDPAKKEDHVLALIAHLTSVGSVPLLDPSQVLVAVAAACFVAKGNCSETCALMDREIQVLTSRGLSQKAALGHQVALTGWRRSQGYKMVDEVRTLAEIVQTAAADAKTDLPRLCRVALAKIEVSTRNSK